MIDQVIDRIYRYLLLAFGRGRVTFVNDSGNVQVMQGKFSDNEIIDDLPVPHDFGFTSNPPVGSDVFACFSGNNRSNGLVVCIGSQQYRLKNLQSGEMAIYDSVGQSVYLSKTGIVINGGGLPMTITNTPKVRMETDLDVTGQVKDNCDSNAHTVADMRAIFNGHTQPDPQGGTVGVPNQQM